MNLLYVLFSCLGLSLGYTPIQLLQFYNDEVASASAESDQTVLNKEVLTECVEMRSEPGIYHIASTEEDQSACGIYLVGASTTQVEILVLDFDVDCIDGGTLTIFDGWEQEGNIFPPVEDVGPHGHRHESFCGVNRPSKVFRSTGNMALIQYRFSQPGAQFTLQVTFPQNPRPCNAVAFAAEGNFMLKNHGLPVNCSVILMYPETFTIEYADVGVNALSAVIPSRKSADKCKDEDPRDYMEVRGGSSIDLSHTSVFTRLCGFGLHIKKSYSIMCGTTMVRLVSSGRYDNTVLLGHKLLNENDLDAAGASICPA